MHCLQTLHTICSVTNPCIVCKHRILFTTTPALVPHHVPCLQTRALFTNSVYCLHTFQPWFQTMCYVYKPVHCYGPAKNKCDFRCVFTNIASFLPVGLRRSQVYLPTRAVVPPTQWIVSPTCRVLLIRDLQSSAPPYAASIRCSRTICKEGVERPRRNPFSPLLRKYGYGDGRTPIAPGRRC